MACLLLFTSCGGTRREPRVLDGPLPTADLIKDAEAILVGTVTSLTFGETTRQSVPLFPQLRDCLVPVRAGVSVENVLRGSVPGGLEFEYFGTVCGTSGPVELLKHGSRSVFFLQRDSGRWRPLADYWRNRLPVYTGRHSDQFLAGKPIEQAISELLLTPGAGYSPEGLAYALAASTPEAASLIGRLATAQLISPLLSHTDLRVRIQACLQLTESGNAFGDCASRIVGENLDLFAREGFSSAVPPGLTFDLERLTAYSDPDTRSRAERLLPFFRIAATVPPLAAPPLPAGLR